jgi:hypothetical protein
LRLDLVDPFGAGASSPRFNDDWLFVDQLEIIRKLLIVEARLRACIIPNRLSGHIIGVENAANDAMPSKTAATARRSK